MRLLATDRSEDIGITSLNNAHTRDSVVSAASSAEVDVGAGVVVDLGLGEHAVILEHGFPKVGTIAGHYDHLDLSSAQSLQCLRESYNHYILISHLATLFLTSSLCRA